jgi:acetyl-CoA carboxylase biotin carboxyl carrier protein
MAEQIRSPLPGTFYRRPDPSSEPFVTEGDQIEPGAVVGLVEIMKSFHEIKSETGGTVSRFLVDDEGSVEIGQALVELET